MVTIKLVGFNKKIPQEIKTEATSYREALEALKMQEGFNPRTSKVRYVCEIPEVKSIIDLDEPVANGLLTLKRKQTLNTLRGFQGSGESNGWVKVIVGVVLIAVAVYMPTVSAGFAALGSAGMVNLNLLIGSVGLAFISGGIAQELLPEVGGGSETEDSSNTATSYPNTVASGTTRAMIFGKHRFGGHLFQFNIEIVRGNSATIREFTDVIWDDISENKRDSWLTLYYNSESNQVGQTYYTGAQTVYKDGIRSPNNPNNP